MPVPSLDRIHTIYGLMSDAEMQALGELVLQASPTGIIAELGTFTGRSSAIIALADWRRAGSPEQWPNRVHTFDTYKYGNGKHRPNAAKNMARLLKHDFPIGAVQFHTLDTVAAAKVVETSEQVAMLFIDSEHTPARVEAELNAWFKRLLLPGAIIAFHDVGHPKFAAYGEYVLKWAQSIPHKFLCHTDTLLGIQLEFGSWNEV